MKKLITLSLMLCCLSAITYSQNVAINTDGSQPDASAALDIKSSNKGMLVPRVTSAQRTAIASPATGLLVYDVTTNSFWFYNGSAWTNLTTAGGNFSLPYYGATSASDTGFHIRQTGTYAAIAAQATQGAGVTGISSTGSGIEGASTSGAGVYGNSVSGAGVNAFSSNGFGIIANSANSSSLYAFNNNAYPAINAVNNNGSGIAINGSSSASNAIVGVSAGTAKAGIRGEATGTSGTGVFGTTTSATGNAVYGNTTSGTGVYGFSNTGTGVKAFSGTLALEVIGNVKISGGTVAPSAGAVLTSDASGNASWQNNRIAFRASGINSSHYGLAHDVFTKFEFGTEDYDYGNNYALLTGTPWSTSSMFTVPKAGVYHFDAHISLDYLLGASYEYGSMLLKLSRNGVETNLAATELGDADLKYFALNISTDVKLQAGDKIWVEGLQKNTDGAASYFSGGNFSGHLVFAD